MLTYSGGVTTLRLDVNGDGASDFDLTFTGNVTSGTSAFLL